MGTAEEDAVAAVDDTRTRVLEAAGPIFADKGYQAATVREICQSADVNLASVNYHFGDKSQLYLEAVRRAHQLRVAQVPLPTSPPNTPPADRLRALIRALTARILGVDAAPWQTRLMMREILNPTAACRAMVEEYFRPLFDLLLKILDEMLPAETPAHRRKQIAFSIVGQCVYYRIAHDVVEMLVPQDEFQEHFHPQELGEHIADVALAALGAIAPFCQSDGSANPSADASTARGRGVNESNK